MELIYINLIPPKFVRVGNKNKILFVKHFLLPFSGTLKNIQAIKKHFTPSVQLCPFLVHRTRQYFPAACTELIAVPALLCISTHARPAYIAHADSREQDKWTHRQHFLMKY
jgi:hypothetical protein